MKYILILILSINFLFANIFELNNLKESKLSSYMSYLKLNNSKDINPYELILSNKFKPLTNPNLGLNFQTAIWTQVKLQNSSNHNLEISLINTIALTQKIDIFIFEDSTLIDKITTGTLSKTKNSYSYNRFNSFELLAKPNKEYTILTKIYNPKGRVDAQWLVMSKDAFKYFIFKDSLIWGIIFGIFIVLFTLLTLFYLILKNRSFLSYLIYMSIFYIYLFINNGFSTLFFGYGELNLVLSHLSGYSIAFFYIWFLDEYLSLSKNKKYTIVLNTMYVFAFYLASTSWIIIFSPIVYSFDDFYFVLTLLILFILLFITTKESIRTKKIPLFYILGQLSLIFAYLFIFLYSLQFIPNKASNQQFIGIFASFEMIFFTIAIFIKIKNTLELKEKNEKLILSQSHFSTIGQTLKNIAHQWKVPTVRLGTLITELEATLFKEQISNDRIDTIFIQMRNSTEFMKGTITEFSNFYTNDIQNTNFKIKEEIDDLQILLIEKMKFLNFKIISENLNTQNIQLQGSSKTFAHICMIIIDNALDIANQRQIKNPWIKITTKVTKNRLIINFEDNCGGILQKPLHKIFDIEISSNAGENRGIGLSIAKMLVEQKINGEIKVKNSLKGAIFTLDLPLLKNSNI